MPRNTIKQRANKRRNTNRVYNGLVRKLNGEGTIQLEEKPPVFYEEDADDRFERHMNQMHKAMHITDEVEHNA